jgi:hypothetical protein
LLHESLQGPINKAPRHFGSAAAKDSSLDKLFEELLRLRRNGDSYSSAVYTILSLSHKLALIMAYLCQTRNEDFYETKRGLQRAGESSP